MVSGYTYFEINLEKEQRINELKTLYTVDELINHCYEEEQKNKRAIEYIEEHNVPYTSYLGKKRQVNKLEIKDKEYDELLNILNGGDEE